MSKTLIFALLLVCAFARYNMVYEKDALLSFQKFKQTFGKTYDSVEHDLAKFAVFKDNLRRIDSFNQLDTATHGIT